MTVANLKYGTITIKTLKEGPVFPPIIPLIAIVIECFCYVQSCVADPGFNLVFLGASNN